MGAYRRGRGAGRRREGARLTPRVCRVQPDVPAVRRAFDYVLPEPLVDVAPVGTVVRVPLHGRRVRGWVVDTDVDAPEVAGERLRPVAAVVSAGPPPEVVDLCRWAAWRWAGPLVTFLRVATAPNVVPAGAAPERVTAVYPEVIAEGGPETGGPLVVTAPADDVAGLVAARLAPEGSTIVVDPDARRAARVRVALERQGREVLGLQSDASAAARTRAWDRARGGACVVVGGRKAVWAPVPDLVAIVVVDEADEALEEERAPTWNAREVACERARRTGAAVHVVTPAPTVDALVLLGLEGGPAPGRRAWPGVAVVDLRDAEPGHGLLTTSLARELRRCVDGGRGAVCVLNRRGRARLLACHSCGELARCERCGATVAQSDDRFVCARCGAERPPVCLHCHATRFRIVRPGVQRLREELAALLPRARVAAVDAATEHPPEAEVFVGTEAVLHRIAVPAGLVAFVELDLELLAPRARAAEQALWLLVRAARLLGEPAAGGVMLLQTRLPEHEVVTAARRGEPLLVARAERERRRALGWPPFGGAAELRGDEVAVTAACAALRGVEGVVVRGPIAGGTRALVQAPSAAVLCAALARHDVDAAHALGRLRVDVDPRRA